MESISLRIEGIYDHRTFKFLKGMGFTSFSFDMRPLSLNFFPQHRFLDLLLQEKNPGHRYYLHYEKEPAFITQKMLDDLKALGFSLEGPTGNFHLEFSDAAAVSFYEQFQVPYFWHYQEGGAIKEILKGNFLRGIVLPYDLLENMSKRGGLFSFLGAFNQLLHRIPREDPLEIFLTAPWDFNIMPSLFDNLDFHCLSLPINQSIEVCYRNVDLEKLKKNLQYFQKNLMVG